MKTARITVSGKSRRSSYKVIWSLLSLAPSLTWLEIDRLVSNQDEKEEGEEQKDEMWNREKFKGHLQHPELEAFILSRSLAFDTENLFKLKKYFFPNLSLLGPLELSLIHI